MPSCRDALRAELTAPARRTCVAAPAGQHGGLARRRNVRARCWRCRACHQKPQRSSARTDGARVAADIVLFTSPNAVRSAAALQDLSPRRRQVVLAVGSGTRNALRRLGIDAQAPARMDSEGLLAMAALDDVAGRRIGLVTGAGGRNLLAPALRRRGAEVTRADTYCRVPAALAAHGQSGLATLAEHGAYCGTQQVEAFKGCSRRCRSLCATPCRGSPWSRPARAWPKPPATPVFAASPSRPVHGRLPCCTPRPIRSFSIAG